MTEAMRMVGLVAIGLFVVWTIGKLLLSLPPREALKPQLEANGWTSTMVGKEFGDLEYHTMRRSVLDTKVRIDGRDLVTVRPITVWNTPSSNASSTRSSTSSSQRLSSWPSSHRPSSMNSATAARKVRLSGKRVHCTTTSAAPWPRPPQSQPAC